MNYKLLPVLLFASINLSGVHSAKINKNHESIAVKEGGSFNLLCTADTNVKACTVQAPNGNTYSIWPGAAYERRITEYSKSKFECGITINKAEDIDNGKWECIISTQGPQESLSYRESINVTVAVPPEKVTLKIGEILAPKEYSVTALNETPELLVDCIAQQARSAPEFAWFLGTEQLKAELSQHENKDEDGKGNYSETLKYHPTSKDNGKKLRCEVTHQAYTELAKQQKKNEAEIVLKISYPPMPSEKLQTHHGLKLGQANSIRMKFNANPKPNKGFWTIGNNTKVEIGTKSVDKRYSSGSIEMEDELDGHWFAELTINELTVDNINKTYTLTVRNKIGETVYKFRLSLKEQSLVAAVEPGVAVAVIVITIILLVAVIIMVVYYRLTRCTSYCVKKKQDKNETEQAKEKEHEIDTTGKQSSKPDAEIENGGRNEDEPTDPETADASSHDETKQQESQRTSLEFTSPLRRMTNWFTSMRLSVTPKENAEIYELTGSDTKLYDGKEESPESIEKDNIMYEDLEHDNPHASVDQKEGLNNTFTVENETTKDAGSNTYL